MATQVKVLKDYELHTEDGQAQLAALLSSGWAVLVTFNGTVAEYAQGHTPGMIILHKPDVASDAETIYDVSDHKRDDLREAERETLLRMGRLQQSVKDTTETLRYIITEMSRNLNNVNYVDDLQDVVFKLHNAYAETLEETQ